MSIGADHSSSVGAMVALAKPKRSLQISATAAITLSRGRWLRKTALPLLMWVATFSNPPR